VLKLTFSKFRCPIDRLRGTIDVTTTEEVTLTTEEEEEDTTEGNQKLEEIAIIEDGENLSFQRLLELRRKTMMLIV
jgi:hypothetical protein